MAHAVSASYARSDHMPPVAALMAGLLHAATALAVFMLAPVSRHDLEDNAVEVTFEEPKPPVEQAAQQPAPPPPAPTPAPAPAPPPAAEAKPPPAPPPAKPEPKVEAKSNEPLGISRPPVETKKPDEPKPQPPQEAKLEPQKPAEAKPQPAPEATVEPAKPAEPPVQPAQEAAVAPPPEPPPPPETPLEKVVPPVETPAAPLSMRDFVKVLPPPAPRPAPQTHPQPAPQQKQEHHALQRSPLSSGSTPAAPGSSGAAVSTFVNPAEAGTSNRAKDAYLWQVIRKLSQYLPDLRDKNEGGTVVLRFVIARDGRLLEASVAKSSGVVALDRGLLDSLRAASPYPPLPPEIPGSQVVFVQPIGAARR